MSPQNGGVEDTPTLEQWDRLILLLIARPEKGWERAFDEIKSREVARCWPSEREETEDEE